MSATVGVGSVLGGSYRLMRRVGGGGMGDVYEAQHTRLPRHFAVKVLRPVLGQRGHLRRFRQEAELTSQLQHPNIVEVVDFNVDGGAPFFVMPFLAGEDMRQRLQRVGRLSLAEAVGVVQQIGSALAATHARGVVHRDLKPRNIFFCNTADDTVLVKVLDFGVSKITGGATQTQEGLLLGSPRYMSPEQARGQTHETDARSDIFALTAILYEVLAGQPAFSARTDVELLRQVMESDPAGLRSLAPQVPPEVEHVVRRGLAKDPDERYQCVQALVEDLVAAAAHAVDDGASPLKPLSSDATTEPTQAPALSALLIEAETVSERPPGSARVENRPRPGAGSAGAGCVGDGRGGWRGLALALFGGILTGALIFTALYLSCV